MRNTIISMIWEENTRDVIDVFYAAPVIAENAIETPAVPGVKMHHMVTIRLSGKPNSGIKHVINGTGDSVITTRKAIVD